MNAYEQAMATVRENDAALLLVKSQAHHTESCRTARTKDRTPDVCSCDLPMHLAAIIDEVRRELSLEE